jgi:hypothetical protein
MGIPLDRYALYAEFGIALKRHSCYEIEAGNVILGFLALLSANKGEIGPDLTEIFQNTDFRSIANDLNRKTLRKLLLLKGWAHRSIHVGHYRYRIGAQKLFDAQLFSHPQFRHV